MNTLSKIYKLAVVIVLSFFLLNARCEFSEREVSSETLLSLFYFYEQDKQERRNLAEPNNDFASAKCIDKSIDSYIYPADDLDFYKLNIRAGSLKLYIFDHEKFGNEYNFGMQIFDHQENLIYDLNQRSFDLINSALIVNRNLTSSDCMISDCSRLLDRYRYIEFSQSNTVLFIKLYAFNQNLYRESKDIFHLEKTENPTNQSSPYGLILQGDFATCS